MAPYPDLLAKGITSTDIPAGFDLFAGESDIVTDQGEAGADLEQFEVIALVDGVWVPYDPAGVDGSENATAIAAQAFLTGAVGPIYTGGVFNHEALVWPAAADTLAERKAAFNGTNIGVRQLL